jgi:hypothetical protein
MAIFVYRNDQQEGPYEIEELRQLLANGSLAPTDLGWREGMADWAAVGDMLAAFPAGGASAEPALAQINTDPLSVWSLVLGILSWVCLPIVAGIPAIVCGHLSLKRQKANAALQGKGMAIAGLVLGYVSILLLIVLLPALALPSISGTLDRSKEALSLARARQIGLAIQSAALDASIAEKKDAGCWPTDAGLKTAADVKEQLIAGGYLTKDDLEKIGFDNFVIGNVAEKDPGSTILVKSRTPLRGVSVVVSKAGDSYILRDGEPRYETDPPRDPPFLE